MSALATAGHPQAAIERPQRGARDRALFDTEATLEENVLLAWEGLVAEGSATCLVCGGSMRREGCVDCGSRLS
jgi:hypothetical protein